MRELLRIGGMCVHDLLEDRFSLPLLKGALALRCGARHQLWPALAGHRALAPVPCRRVAGGGCAGAAARRSGRAVGRARRRRACRRGTDCALAAPVERILVREDQVAGVALASGEEITAASVVSSADPKSTFLKLLGAEHLDAGFVRRVTQVRTRGLTAKLHLALDRAAGVHGPDGVRALRARLLVAPSADYIERAYNHAKYEEFSQQPMLEITVPSLADPSLAPAGKHVMSVIVQYAPYALKGGWAPQQRQAFTERVLETLCTYAPQLRAFAPGERAADAAGHRAASSASPAVTGTTPSWRWTSS